MHGDDGSKTALRTSNGDDVFVFGPGQTLEHVVCLSYAQDVHVEILWAMESSTCSENPQSRLADPWEVDQCQVGTTQEHGGRVDFASATGDLPRQG